MNLRVGALGASFDLREADAGREGVNGPGIRSQQQDHADHTLPHDEQAAGDQEPNDRSSRNASTGKTV